MLEILKNKIYSFSLWFKSLKHDSRFAEARMILVVGSEVLLVMGRSSQFWNFPGGGIDKDEDAEIAAIRELNEECRIKVSCADFCLGHYSTRKNEKPYVVSVFVKKLDQKPPIRKSLEIKSAEWFDLTLLPQEINPLAKKRIEEYMQGMRNIEKVW